MTNGDFALWALLAIYIYMYTQTIGDVMSQGDESTMINKTHIAYLLAVQEIHQGQALPGTVQYKTWIPEQENKKTMHLLKQIIGKKHFSAIYIYVLNYMKPTMH